jgi:ADP-L-glycero-D-manno-heptose 6-epimerase
MIVVTGAAGFIGSNMLAKLIENHYYDLVLVDDFSNPIKELNYSNKQIKEKVDRESFGSWLDYNHKFVEFIFHLGARTNTAEFDINILNKLNTEYSKMVWRKCCEYGIPLVYASSAATYGLGEHGYDDNTDPSLLSPLNPYGVSKNEFDKWALLQDKKPYFWAGIKFFNVYGPNEYHKARMTSVIFHSYHQILETGKISLFKSHRDDFQDGEQQRDFIYVKDVVDVLFFFMENRKNSGIYNLGTGIARSFNDLAKSTFAAMEIIPDISYIDTPVDIRDKYQYFTQANISKLRSIGYNKDFYSLENGVDDYVQNYLIPNKYN